MRELPATLTYFTSLHRISQIVNKSALPLIEAHEYKDPFLPDRNTLMPFSVTDLYEASRKYISHAIFADSPPRGQPSHPLQKAIIRWRTEHRFNDENEIKQALQGLLPAMVEQTFNEAKAAHDAWLTYVASKRTVSFYEKFQELDLWGSRGLFHSGVAIKFDCPDDSIFSQCHPVRHQKVPANTVIIDDYVEYMVGAIPQIETNLQAILLTQNYAHRRLKEWRLITNASEHKDEWLDFPIKLIRSVYIGALVNPNAFAPLKYHLAKLDPRINVYHARCKTNAFELDFEKIS